MRQTTLTIVFLTLIAVVSAPAALNHVVLNDPQLDEVELLGMAKETATALLGEPAKVLGPAEGYQTYEYPDRQMSVVFHQGQLVQYMIQSPSQASTVRGIHIGSPLEDVVKEYGPYERQEDVTQWFTGSDEKVLYHHPRYDRYKLNYPTEKLIILFDKGKKVEHIWIRNFWMKNEMEAPTAGSSVP